MQAVSAMFSLSKEKSLLGMLRKYSWKVISLCIGRTSRVGPRIRRVHNMVVFLFKMRRNHGTSYTIKWMKSCHVAVQRKVSGAEFVSLRELEPGLPLPRLINGLPPIIGPSDRRSIRLRDHKVISMWLSFFGLYRVLESPYKASLDNIVSHSSQLNEKLFNEFIDYIGGTVTPIEVKPASKFLVNNSSGPNGENAAQSLLTDAVVLSTRFPKVYSALIRYLKFSKSRDLLRFLLNCASLGARLNKVSEDGLSRSFDTLRKRWISSNGRILSKDDLSSIPVSHLKYKKGVSFHNSRAGQLSFKEEASGKLRFFAIVENFTQSALDPLHSALFLWLKALPNDGTFDQDASVERCARKASFWGCAWSLDLTAATDRLPISLQKKVLDCLWRPGAGYAWSSLLVDRGYIIPNKGKKYGLVPGTFVHYATGQPMGARSSWAMLSVTHHLILQFCAYKVYNKIEWSDKYEVLGDDIVIFDQKIKDQYLHFMNQVDVGINLAKSLPAEKFPVIEFAKRTVMSFIDISGVPWKQLIAEDSLQGRINLVLSLIRRRMLTGVPVLLAALARNSNECKKIPISSEKNYQFFCHSMIMILGSLIPLKSVVETLVNPHDEEVPIEGFTTYPLFQAVTNVFNHINGVDVSFSESETRKELVHDELHPALVDHLMGQTLDIYIKLRDNYDDYILVFAKSLVKYYNLLDKVEQAQLIGIAEEILLSGEDPYDWYDDFNEIFGSDYWDPLGITIEQAADHLDRATSRLSRFDRSAVRNVIVQKSWLSRTVLRSLNSPPDSAWKHVDPRYY